MLGAPGKLGGISERDRDTISELEVLNSDFEEISPSLGSIQEHELDVGLLQGHHKSRHSPTAPEIAPALAGHRSSRRVVGSRVLHMGQEVTGTQKTVLLAAPQHGNEAFFCRRHDAGNRIRRTMHISRPRRPGPGAPLIFASLTGRSGPGMFHVKHCRSRNGFTTGLR